MNTLYWIDDTHDEGKPPDQRAKARIEKALKIKLLIATIGSRSQFGELLPTIVQEKPLGVIMDYQLTKVSESGQTVFGSTWAAEIRAACPSIAMIGISHELEKNIPTLRLKNFLEFFPRGQLTGIEPRFDDLSALLKGYKRVFQAKTKEKDKSRIDLMKRLIRPPSSVAELVSSAIPSSLREPWDDETPHVASRWLWHELQGLPGFLFDELALATYLGLNLKGLNLSKIRSKFDSARYKGEFASEARPRWWVASIRRICEQVINRQIIGPVANVRDKLLDIAEVAPVERNLLLSRAHGHRSTHDIPDCVAYRDDELEERDRVQAVFDETRVDERDLNMPFGFEARRIYKGR